MQSFNTSLFTRLIYLLIVGLFPSLIHAEPIKGSLDEMRLKRSASSSLLQFQGKPWVPIGDSISQAWMELGTDFNQDAYLDLLNKKGINSLMIWAYIGINDQSQDARIKYHAPRIWPWREASKNVKPPYKFIFHNQSGEAVFNEAYFKRLRSLAESALKRNIVLHISIHDGWTKTRFPGHPLNRKNGGPLEKRDEYVRFSSYDTLQPKIFPSGGDAFAKNQWIQERFTEKLLLSLHDMPNILLEVMNEGEWYNREQTRKYLEHLTRFIKDRSYLPVVIYEHSLKGSSVLSELADAVSYHAPYWSRDSEVYELRKIYASHVTSHAPLPILLNEPVPEYLGKDSEGLFRFMWGAILGGAGFWLPNDTGWKYPESGEDVFYNYLSAANKVMRSFLRDFDLAQETIISNETLAVAPAHCLMRPERAALCFIEGGEYKGKPGFRANVQAFFERESGLISSRKYRLRIKNPYTSELFNEEIVQEESGRYLEIFLPDKKAWLVEIRVE